VRVRVDVETDASSMQWEDVQNPQLSPDGRQIIFTRRWVNPIDDRWDSQVWIMNADGSRARYLTDGSSPIWSPDGSRVAWFSDDGNGYRLLLATQDGLDEPRSLAIGESKMAWTCAVPWMLCW
jgi:Tol biopolymer transport system component